MTIPHLCCVIRLMELASETKTMMATNEGADAFSRSDGPPGRPGPKPHTRTSMVSTSKSTGHLPDIHRGRTLPEGLGSLTKVIAPFNKHNAKSVFNKRNATLEVKNSHTARPISLRPPARRVPCRRQTAGLLSSG